jgi:hypothetical protein
MSNETVTIFENITQYKDVINNNTLNSKTANNMTADSLGISREYALKEIQTRRNGYFETRHNSFQTAKLCHNSFFQNLGHFHF